MNELFLKIINMSISVSWLILAVLILRIVLKKAPKWVNVLLWGIVAVRLICPFSFESTLSLIPSSETIPLDIEMAANPAIDSGVPAINSMVNPVLSSFAPPQNLLTSANPLQIWIPIFSIIWFVGVTALLLYTAVSYWRLRRKVDTAVRYKDNIFQSENVSSPFVLGIIKPRIYLPFNMNGQDLEHVVAHEQAHIRRKDHWWKPLGFLLLTIHWFNPLMWLAYVLLCRDIELACDEKVIKELGNEQRADYTQALVACSVNHRMIAACPLAFGEVGVKERVKSVMNYKKPAFWIVVLAVIACVVVAVCFLTNPKGSTIYDIYRQDGYTVIDQEEVDVTLYVDKSKLPDSIYTAEGYEFEENEVVVYSTETTKVYLYKAMISNESDDLLYFIFDFSYDFPKAGSIISPYKYTGEHDGTQSNLYLRSKDLRDVSTAYPDALNIRGYGPGTQFAFYVSKDACQTADERLMIDIVCNQIVYAKEGHGYESQQDSSSKVQKWFDYTEDPSQMSYENELKIKLDEFPDITFRYTPYEIITTTSWDDSELEGHTILISGMPIWNTYFCDLTGDGLPELCSTISWGSGMIDNRVMIYDYANGISYSLEDRGVSDYTLRQDESDGQLYVDKNAHIGGGLLSTGQLAFEDNCLQVLWPVKPNDNIREITDPTDDPNFAYDTAVEKIYEDERNEYFISGLYSQHIIVHYTDGTQEDIVTALNSGRATIADLGKFGIRYWAEPKADPLDAAISAAILDHYRSDTPDGLIHVESHILLGNETVSGTPVIGAANHVTKTMVYLLVHHVKYSTYGGTLAAVGGSYVPAAITFKISDSGEYIPEEYWEPRDGSYYVKDIRGKFPGTSADDALNDQAYIEELKAQTYNKALAYLNSIGSLDVRIAELLDEIQSSPAYSSNPGDYIEVHEAAYKELLSYGEYTLRYCFDEFLQGGQTGLRGHIMRALLDDLAPEAQLRLYAMTGQEYFDEWKAGAIRVSEQHDMDWIEKHQPAIWLLLQMIEE